MWFTIISMVDPGPTLQILDKTKFAYRKVALNVCTGVLFPCLRWSPSEHYYEHRYNTTGAAPSLPPTTLRTLWFAAWRVQTVRLCQLGRYIECLTEQHHRETWDSLLCPAACWLGQPTGSWFWTSFLRIIILLTVEQFVVSMTDIISCPALLTFSSCNVVLCCGSWPIISTSIIK